MFGLSGESVNFDHPKLKDPGAIHELIQSTKRNFKIPASGTILRTSGINHCYYIYICIFNNIVIIIIIIIIIVIFIIFIIHPFSAYRCTLEVTLFQCSRLSFSMFPAPPLKLPLPNKNIYTCSFQYGLPIIHHNP